MLCCWCTNAASACLVTGYYLPAAVGLCELCPAGSECNETTAIECAGGSASVAGQSTCSLCPTGNPCAAATELSLTAHFYYMIYMVMIHWLGYLLLLSKCIEYYINVIYIIKLLWPMRKLCPPTIRS